MVSSTLNSTDTVLQVTYNDILTMNIFGDLEDLEGNCAAITPQHLTCKGAFTSPESWVPATVRGLGRCSALIRSYCFLHLLGDSAELSSFVG